ncbi:hypothetical protein D3C75_1274500 [compost metagenome]
MRADRRLDRNIKLLAWDQLFHFLNQFTATILRVITVSDQRQRIYTFVVDQHVNAHHVGGLETFEVIIQ